MHEHPVHPNFLSYPYSYITSQLLKVMQPHELTQIKLNQDTRRVLLHAYQIYYALHVQDFGVMKTLPVLQEVLGASYLVIQFYTSLSTLDFKSSLTIQNLPGVFT